MSFDTLENTMKLWWNNQYNHHTMFYNTYMDTFRLLQTRNGVKIFPNIVTKLITNVVNECERIDDFDRVKSYIYILINMFAPFYEETVTVIYQHPKIQHIGEDIMLNKKAEWITFNKQRQQNGLEPLATFPTQQDYDELAKNDRRSGSESAM